MTVSSLFTFFHDFLDFCGLVPSNLGSIDISAGISLAAAWHPRCSVGNLPIISSLFSPLLCSFWSASLSLGICMVWICGALPLRVSHLYKAAWNTSTCLFMVWTGLGCLNSFINSIVWNKNIMNWAPVWCDICKWLGSSSHQRYLTWASPSFALHHRCGCWDPNCIPLHQSSPLPHHHRWISHQDQGWKAPWSHGRFGYWRWHSNLRDDPPYVCSSYLLLTDTHLPRTEYIVQGHRFNIYEDVGCWPATYNTPYAYLLVFSWPVVIALVSAVYCCKHRIIIIVLVRHLIMSS